MWKTIAVASTAAAIIGGAGTAALAASETTTPPAPSVSSSSSTSDTAVNGSTTRGGEHKVVDRLRRAEHASWVTQNKKTKTFTTHESIRGAVTAVSPTSITVKAADNVTEIFVLTPETKVHSRLTKAAASISDVKSGDAVLVVGTGTTTLTATRVVETKP